VIERLIEVNRSRRVVHQDAETSEGLHCHAEQPPHLVLGANVAAAERRAPAGPFDLVNGFLTTGFVDVGDDHRPASAGQAAGDRSARSIPAGSCHHCYSACVVFVVDSPNI
jgi:hypothetical protein